MPHDQYGSMPQRPSAPGTASDPPRTEPDDKQPPAPTRDRVSMRGGGPLVFPLILMGILFLLARFVSQGSISYVVDVGGRSYDVGATAAMMAPALPASVLVLMLLMAPAVWARQGVEVDEHGITVVKRPLLWSRGRTASIPWEDVYYIKKTASSRKKLMLEVQLSRVDHELRMPGWARLVLAGETKLGSTSPRSRVLFLAGHDKVGDIERLLWNARPDLFEAPTAAAGPSAARGTTEAQWVNLRWRAALFGTLMIVVLLPSNFLMAGEILRDISPGGAFILLLCLGTSALMVWALPRMFTRQGVAVDSSGITLVQDSALWFAGATLHIPWPEVRTTSEGVVVRSSGENSGRSVSATVEVMLRSPDWVSQGVPNWASVVGQEIRRSPASPTEPLTRITIKPGNRIQPRVVEALHAVRPDLAPAG